MKNTGYRVRGAVFGALLAVGAFAPAASMAADVTEARIVAADKEPGNWLSYGRTYDEQRYSPLNQISDANVSGLAPAWSLDTGTVRGLEATPIVVDGIMYASLSWGITIAVDARTGKELWRFDPEVPGETARYACCDVVNRGVAVWKGKVFVASLDGRLFALDAKKGTKIWEVKTVPGAPYTVTGAPRIVKDKVIIGNGGGEMGVRGYITAYDTETGKQVWRFYTVPGDPSKPVENPELTAAIPTWKGGEWWKVGGGGTAWDSLVYDPALNLLYVGTGNGSPWTRAIRSPGGGDNLYIASILALDPDTGRMRWHYQQTPGDNWDYTSTQPLMLADLPIKGKQRQVIMHAPKNGFFYVLDRKTGELLSADNYVAVNWALGVDLKTGRPIENPEVAYDKETKVVLPSPSGAHNWHPMAFNPKERLVYIPVHDMAGIYALERQHRKDGTFTPVNNFWNTGVDFPQTFEDAKNGKVTPPPTHGYLKAWDPIEGKVRWQVEYAGPYNGGVLATAGNLVFQGTADGYLYAYAADSGKKLWEKHVQTGIVAPPITYSVDGEQYVAVLAGWGGAGIAAGTPNHSAAIKYGNDGRLIAFKVGGTAALPKLAERDQRIPEWPKLNASEATVARGEELYNGKCFMCHGGNVVSLGTIPDLRHSSPEVRDQYQEIVRGGLLQANGMASFADLLSADDVEAIKAYVHKRALEDRAQQVPTQ